MWKSLFASIVHKPRASSSDDIDAASAQFHGGRLDNAEEQAQRIVQRDPSQAQAWNILGAIALERNDPLAAARLFEAAVEFAPSDAGILSNLAETRRRANQLDEAEAVCHKALAVDSTYTPAMHTLALILTAQGRGLEAFECYRRLLLLAPDFTIARSGFLFLLYLTDMLDPGQVTAENIRYAQSFDVPPRWRSYRHANVLDPERRLRIGYVSADLYQHAVSYFAEPLLSGHDAGNFDVFSYSGVGQPDEVTAKLRGLATNWREVAMLDDDDFADLVVDDAIDILVDLSGITKGNRLAVFARKPSPLQITWFGYPGTTGLQSVDYRITDALCDPPGVNDAFYSERLLRLPDILYCYQPPADMPEVAEPPFLRNGYVTFGGMTGAAKLTPQWIALWARLLNELPATRLLLASIPAGKTHDRIHAAFAQQGVDPMRIEIHERTAYATFWALHHRIDIALDTYPCNGGTTSCETLWLGVPVVTMAGNRFASRIGLSMLTRMGLPETIAQTPDEYMTIARNLASNPACLVELRRGQRARMHASPLTDQDRFMRNLEQAYRGIWREWCGKHAQR